MACSSGCRTKDHASYGECLRAKSVQVTDPNAHGQMKAMYDAQNEYVKARNEGMQPDGVGKAHVDFARKVTQLTGRPYRGDSEDVSYLAEKAKK